ncbi:uncharacterized protein TNCV_2533571 [Trichonephila clavipes]|nr:uncharacterized protein TNCV_2533571 [Trichonephila clavipes]
MNVMTVLMGPLEYHDFRVYFELDEKTDISERPSVQIRAIVYETIERKYPSNFWIHVYTNGSMIELGTGAGAGVYSNNFAFYKAVVRYTTNFDGEIEAIFVALNQLSSRKRNISWSAIL